MSRPSSVSSSAAAPARPLVGREKRRTDLYGRLRRMLYGVLLMWANMPGNVLAGEHMVGHVNMAPHIGGLHDTGQSGIESAMGITPQPGMVLIDSGAIHALTTPLFSDSVDWWGHRGERGRAIPVSLSQFKGQLPEIPWLTNALVEAAGDGVGFDLSLPGLGTVFLDLYSDGDRPGDGLRWSASQSADAIERDVKRSWSFGGSVDVIRTAAGDRELVINPQLHVDVGANFSRLAGMEATVVYAYWRPTTERLVADERVVQVEFSWTF